MRSEHVLGDLSAYIDGESTDPEGIARHLQQCPSCARRYMELSRLSSHLRALRGPEVHPAFSTRVMAAIAEAPQGSRLKGWRRVLAPAAAALAFLGIAAAGYVYLLPGGSEPIADTSGFSSLDADWLLEEVERRVSEGEELTLALPVIQEADEALLLSSLSLVSPGGYEDYETVVREEVSFEPVGIGDEAWAIPVSLGGESDVAQSVEALDDAERAVFRELLIEYALEDVT
jgi:hypothetical protein